jgi:hypothetical protein
VPLTDRSRAILEARLPFSVKEHQLRYAWEKAKTAMGMSQDEDFVFHCLRHTRATRLVELGVNLRVIQQFMGHRSIQTTLRYAHVSDDMLADACLANGQREYAAGRQPPDTRGGGQDLACNGEDRCRITRKCAHSKLPCRSFSSRHSRSLWVFYRINAPSLWPR